MNSELLALALLNEPNATLQEIDSENANRVSEGISRSSFRMLSERGEVIGYIKTWHDDDDYAGFVHFDSDGNIVDWKAFTRNRCSARGN
ncbi:MAG: hypothetical protein ACQETT_03965 [Pseudomonadota bacterium]